VHRGGGGSDDCWVPDFLVWRRRARAPPGDAKLERRRADKWNLGNAYVSLGDYSKAVEYHAQHLAIAKEVDDRAGEGVAYGNLGNAFVSLQDYSKAIQYYAQYPPIAKEVGDRAGEGGVYGKVGNAYSVAGGL
jgi:tetratricopeptide (TPR) repeat protein